MQTTSMDNSNRIRETYSLVIVFMSASCLQWFLIKTVDSCDFLLNRWLLLAAVIIFFLIITISLAVNLAKKILPSPLEWLFAILLIEIMVIILSPVVKHVHGLMLYITLPVITTCMAIILLFGRKSNGGDLLPIFGMLIYFSNMVLFLLILILMLVAQFFENYYHIIFFIVLSIVVPILLMNTVFGSMLIGNEHFQPETITDCLKPALYIHFIFVALVWFCLALEVELSKPEK